MGCALLSGGPLSPFLCATSCVGKRTPGGDRYALASSPGGGDTQVLSLGDGVGARQGPTSAYALGCVYLWTHGMGIEVAHGRLYECNKCLWSGSVDPSLVRSRLVGGGPSAVFAALYSGGSGV